MFVSCLQIQLPNEIGTYQNWVHLCLLLLEITVMKYLAYLSSILCRDMNKHFQGY